MPQTEAYSRSNYGGRLTGSWKHLWSIDLSRWEGVVIKEGGGGRAEKGWKETAGAEQGWGAHLSFSLLWTKRTSFALTSAQLKWPAFSSGTSLPFLESSSWPLVGVLTTWNNRSSTLPSWCWTFRREKSRGFIDPIPRVKVPFTCRLGVCISSKKNVWTQRSDLSSSLIGFQVFIVKKWDFSANSEAHRRDVGYSTTPASSYPEESHLDAHEDTRAETEGLDGELLEDSIEIN